MLQLVNVPLTTDTFKRKMAIQNTSLIDVSSCSSTEFISSKKRFLQLKRRLYDYSLFIQELYHCKLGRNCKRTSKRYLTVVNYMLFLKVKINSLIIFALLTLLSKFLHQVRLISFSVNQAMNPITENELVILLKEVVNIRVFHL